MKLRAQIVLRLPRPIVLRLNHRMSYKTPESIKDKIVAAIFQLIAHIPKSQEPKADDPDQKVRDLIDSASWRAAAISGGMALAPGPLGMLTIIPDLYAIWRTQSQLVSDIAAIHGKSPHLRQQEMLYCLFRHGAAVLFRDLITRVGERVLIREASVRAMQNLVQKIGVKISQRFIGRSISRWVPLVGAAGIAYYAKVDTRKVGETAQELFSRELERDPRPLTEV